MEKKRVKKKNIHKAPAWIPKLVIEEYLSLDPKTERLVYGASNPWNRLINSKSLRHTWEFLSTHLTDGEVVNVISKAASLPKTFDRQIFLSKPEMRSFLKSVSKTALVLNKKLTSLEGLELLKFLFQNNSGESPEQILDILSSLSVSREVHYPAASYLLLHKTMSKPSIRGSKKETTEHLRSFVVRKLVLSLRQTCEEPGFTLAISELATELIGNSVTPEYVRAIKKNLPSQ